MSKGRITNIIRMLMKRLSKKRYAVVPDVPSFLQKYVQGGI